MEHPGGRQRTDDDLAVGLQVGERFCDRRNAPRRVLEHVRNRSVPARRTAGGEATVLSVVDRARLAGEFRHGVRDVGERRAFERKARETLLDRAALSQNLVLPGNGDQLRAQLARALRLHDRDPRQMRKARGERLLLGVEGVRCVLVVEEEDADDLLAHDHRHAEHASHAPSPHRGTDGPTVSLSIADENRTLAGEDLTGETIGSRPAHEPLDPLVVVRLPRLRDMSAVEPRLGFLEVHAAAAASHESTALACDQMEHSIGLGFGIDGGQNLVEAREHLAKARANPLERRTLAICVYVDLRGRARHVTGIGYAQIDAAI